MRILSLGAGVQSTTLALMAARGDIAPFDAAIFADTKSEPAKVYRHLARLTAALPFPVKIVSKGSLRQELIDASEGKSVASGRPPLFVKMQKHDSAGIVLVGQFTKGMTNRQCTGDYKIDVIQKAVRLLAGIKARSRGPKTVAVVQSIGISLDEAHRMKDARFRWIRHAYPLIDAGLNRLDCEKLLASWGWPDVPKSACTFCPYHSDAMWLDMKRNDPESWADAVDIDRRLRSGHNIMLKGEPYLHVSLMPLELVDFEARLAKPKKAKQGRLYLPMVDVGGFGNECEGMCGV